MEPGSIVGEWSLAINQSQQTRESSFQPSQSHVRGAWDTSTLAPPGKNILTVTVKTDRPDGGLLNPLYLAGDFGVSLSPLRLTTPLQDGLFEKYTSNLLPYYAGVIEYQIPFDCPSLPDAPRLRVRFDFPGPFHEACEIIFNRGMAHALPWGPYEIDIDRSELRPIGNLLTIRVYTTLIRSFEGQEFDPLQHRYVSIQGS